MTIDNCVPHQLFGGSLSTCFPERFEDVSNVREVPDHQEVYVDPNRDESIIIELLDFKNEVEDSQSAVWFFHDLAKEQDAGQSAVIEHTETLQLAELDHEGATAIVETTIGRMAISKGRQGREAQNVVRVYLANIRLKNVATDVLITVYEPLLINPLSETAHNVGAGLAVPAEQSGLLPASEVFRLAVTSFKIHNWGLFTPGA